MTDNRHGKKYLAYGMYAVLIDFWHEWYSGFTYIVGKQPDTLTSSNH